MSESLQLDINTLKHGDCVVRMNALPAGSVDLVFADPPFNIGYDYDVYDDARESNDYLDWSAKWIEAVYRVLKSDGTFWLAIGDEYAAELKIQSQKAGFHCRSWVVWYYTFGVNCAYKFTRSHAHLFYFVKDLENCKFRSDDLENRVPSARELVYNDKRANPKGRLPDDTWIIRPEGVVGEFRTDEDGSWAPESMGPPSDNNHTFTLRPQDLETSFQPDEDTWYFPRVAGTFKERAGFHGCQMPEQLLGRIVRSCSEAGDLVLDPFSGSATTLAVAKKLGRSFLGFDLSQDYIDYGTMRLKSICVGDRLDGAAEPNKSAPKTGGKKAHEAKARLKRNQKPDEREKLAAEEARHDTRQLEMTLNGIAHAFQQTHDGYSVDRVVADPDLNAEFAAACDTLGLVGDPRTWNTLLFRLRKAGKLAHIPATRRTQVSLESSDRFLFASEIAWQSLLNDDEASSLDEILCDPALAARFDELAGRLVPDVRPFEFRWAALSLRKAARVARSRSAALTPPRRFGDFVPVAELKAKSLPEGPGLYVLSESEKKPLYVGETPDLRGRFKRKAFRAAEWQKFADTILVQTIPLDYLRSGRFAWQCCLIRKLSKRPRLNSSELSAGK